MTAHVGLVAAQLHAVLVARPGSRVVHVYSGPLTPSGRFVPRAARTACTAHTRRLSVLERVGSVLDLGGRRVCGRCSARLSAMARRAEQPHQREACVAFYAGLTLADVVVAIAMATTVEETHRIGFAMGLRFPPAPARRPSGEGDRDRFRAALFDVNTQLLRRRNVLRAAERTPEEVEAAAAARELEAMRDAQILAERRRSDRIARAVDRRNNSQYLTPWEKDLLSTA